MYNHIINITVFGENSFLKNIVETIPSMDYLDCTVICLENFDPSLAAQSDIIIFNGRANFHEARGCAKPDAYLVACLGAWEEECLPVEDCSALDDIWQVPISELGMRMRMAHLLIEIGARISSDFRGRCLDTFINSLPDLVWFKDLGGHHKKVNDYFCDFVGKPREEIEEKTHEEIWGAPESEDDFTCHDTERAAIETGETVIAEEVVKTARGNHLFKTIKTPLAGPNGEILGTVGIAHDITNLLNLNIELGLFIEVMPFPLMLCDRDENVAKVNAKFLEFFETGIDAILGLPWRDWYEENILHEISPTGEDIYLRFMHADGSMSFLKMVSHEMNDTFGNYRGVIHVFEDVTSEKELEYNTVTIY